MKRAIIECGAAETRAALLIDDVVWKVWFGPARGDEKIDEFPRAGRRFAGRVMRVDPGLAAAFLDLGDGQDAFLPLKKSNAAACVEGALLAVDIKSPPRQGKGALLRFAGAMHSGAPGRMPPYNDPVLDAAEAVARDADELLVDDGAASRVLQSAGFHAAAHETHPVSLFVANGVDGEFEAAFDRVAALSDGGRLVIDEAQALTAIDVDTGGLSASSPARLREKVALLAANEAVRQVSLRKIGGHIVIDFPEITSDAGRNRFRDHLHKALSRLEGAGAASFSKSGLFSFNAPHRELSLLDRFTETAACDPVAGRRFTVDALAKRAIAGLERNLRSAPSARYHLILREDVNAYLALQSRWTERLVERFGARFEITAGMSEMEQGFELSEQ
ncbi:MAG: ribonuclease E/G [Pseudomonadota bacterium]